MGRCIKELERIYGVRDGSANEKGNNRIGEPKVSDDQLSQSDIADMIGISVDTLSNYKKLTELVPELQDWVETGILAPTTAIAIMNNFGRRKNDPSKDRKALETYVSLRGYKNGELGNGRKKGCQDGIAKLTLDEIAKELNMSKRNLQRALRIERNLTDSMKEFT